MSTTLSRTLPASGAGSRKGILAVLSAAFKPSFLQLKYVLLDICWRFLWLVLSFVISIFASSMVLAQLGPLAQQGPELAGSSPIILLVALREFWEKYGLAVLATSGLLLLALLLLWIFLEALFRGGFRGFSTYFLTGIARTTLLFGTLGIFLLLSARDKSGGTLLVGVVFVIAMWFLIGMFEAVARGNAVELLATDLPRLSAVLGSLRFLEGAIAFLLLGSAAAAWMRAADKALLGIWFFIVGLIWMCIQSYLVAVRYSAIDIMRRNGVGS